jgi:hypothetical protein
MSIVLGLYFTYLGWLAHPKSIGKKLSAAIVLYLMAIIGTILIDYYYQSHLVGSTGG